MGLNSLQWSVTGIARADIGIYLSSACCVFEADRFRALFLRQTIAAMRSNFIKRLLTLERLGTNSLQRSSSGTGGAVLCHAMQDDHISLQG